MAVAIAKIYTKEAEEEGLDPSATVEVGRTTAWDTEITTDFIHLKSKYKNQLVQQ